MASVTPYEAASGRRSRVRYRLPDHSQSDKRGFKTRRDAELLLASVEVTKARGEFVSASQSTIPLGEWAELWRANQVQLKPSTRLGYETIVRAAPTAHPCLPTVGVKTGNGLHHERDRLA